MFHPYDLIFTGLVFDIAGALILAKGFMFKNPRVAFYESLVLFGGNNHFLKSALLQRDEAWVGGLLLISGFGFQIWGNLDGGVAATDLGRVNSLCRVLALLIAVGVFALMCLTLAHWHARTAFHRILFQDYTGEPLTVPPDDRTWLDRRAVLLNIRRQRHESDAALLARVQAKHAKLGAKHAGQAGEPFRIE
jgi:hypothetical protein